MRINNETCIVPNRAEWCRIVPKRAESCRIVPNRAETCRIVPNRAESCHIVPCRIVSDCAALSLAFAPLTFDCTACVFDSPSRSLARAAYCFDPAAWLPIALLMLVLGPFAFLLARLFDGLFNVSTSFTSYTICSEIPSQRRQ